LDQAALNQLNSHRK